VAVAETPHENRVAERAEFLRRLEEAMGRLELGLEAAAADSLEQHATGRIHIDISVSSAGDVVVLLGLISDTGDGPVPKSW
jgi:hypothetical protein